MTSILVTGGAGCIGSHFCEAVQATTDWHMHLICTFNHRGDKRRLAALDPKRYTLHMHDLSQPIPLTMEKAIGGVEHIFHFAAESHVDRSLDDPVPFIRNNVDVTLNMLEYARQNGPRLFFQISTDEVYGPAPDGTAHKEWDVILPSNPYSASKAAQEAIAISYWRSYGVPVVITNCWDMQTKVMGEDGFLAFDEVSKGDRVWVLNDKEELALEAVEEIVRMPGPAEMIRFSSEKVNQLVTPNHRVMHRRSIGRPRRWMNISESPAESFVGIKGQVSIPLTGIWLGDSSPDGMPTQWDKEWLVEVFGWYVSEGYKAGRYGICFGAGTDHQVQELKQLLSRGGFKSHQRGRSVRIGSRKLMDVLLECGDGADNKQVPRWIRALPVPLLRTFWLAAMKGDGSALGRAGAEVYYTKSPILAEHMAEIGMKIGYAVRISKRRTWNPKKTKMGLSYIVRFRSPNVGGINKRHVSRERYAGDVWCIRVPSGRVFVMRDGIVSLSGQTMNNFCERQNYEKFVPKTLRAVLRGEKAIVHGSPGDIGSRFYMHARNHGDALLWLTKWEHNRYPIADRPSRFNIVGDREMNNLEMAEMIAKFAGKPLDYELVDAHSRRPGHDRRYALDGTLLHDMGWRAPVPFEESLERTIKWTMTHPEWLL